MKILPQKTMEDMIKHIRFLQNHSPYQYSGNFYCAQINGLVYAQRSLQTLKNKAKKENIAILNYTIV